MGKIDEVKELLNTQRKKSRIYKMSLATIAIITIGFLTVALLYFSAIKLSEE